MNTITGHTFTISESPRRLGVYAETRDRHGLRHFTTFHTTEAFLTYTSYFRQRIEWDRTHESRRFTDLLDTVR